MTAADSTPDILIQQREGTVRVNADRFTRMNRGTRSCIPRQPGLRRFMTPPCLMPPPLPNMKLMYHSGNPLPAGEWFSQASPYEWKIGCKAQ